MGRSVHQNEASASESPLHACRFGANTAAARASAATATATERMKESMAGSLAAMKNLNLGFKRPTAPDH